MLNSMLNVPLFGSTCSRRSFVAGATALAGAALLPQLAHAETTDASSVTFTNPGAYSATAAGRNGDITVSATFSADAIESIDVDSSETPTVGAAAMDTLTQEVLDGQTLGVETVSGATISCNAFIAALEDCVEQAGGNVEALSTPAEKQTTEYETQADVVIVGAGGAGLMAAITAANDGASVVVLEKSGVVGGNTLCASNGINAFDSDVQLADPSYQAADTSFKGFEELQTNERSRKNLVDAFISNSAEAINYLSGLGVEFTVEISNDERNSSQNYYLLKSEADGTTTMTTIIAALDAAVKDAGIPVYTGVAASELVVDGDGRVCGVKATGPDGQDLEFSCSAVVLTTGGFGKNKELIAQVAPAYANCITDEMAPTTGDGLIMAQEVGAQAVDLDQIQTFPSVIEGYGMSFPAGGFGVDGAIYVNNAGERFCAEAFEVPQEILAQDKGEAYAIFDTDDYDERMQGLAGQGYVKSADNAQELGDELGFDGEGLAATIEQWNADAATGTDSVFGRENSSTLDAPLYGYKFGVGAHYFMGGVLIDETTRVLDDAEQPIEGLYAAGEVTGGFHGTQRVDGSGTGDSIVFGMIAGHTTAAAARA